MSGHSKWANTKHRKAAQDIKKGKIFTKNIRELVTAVRLGGNDINYNSRLRVAIDKALSNNMTRDTINRAISRGIGLNNNSNIENIRFEGYGPGGTAIILECTSENKNRTVSEIRNAFVTNGGNLSTDGSVSYLFNKKGVIYLYPGYNEDKIMEIVLEFGVDDIVKYKNGSINIYTKPELIIKIKNLLINYKIIINSYEITMVPYVFVSLNEEIKNKLKLFINKLENIDFIQNIYHNCSIYDN